MVGHPAYRIDRPQLGGFPGCTVVGLNEAVSGGISSANGLWTSVLQVSVFQFES